MSAQAVLEQSHFFDDHAGAIALWFVFALVVGVIAAARGRRLIVWYLLSLALSPVIALIGLFFFVQPIRVDE